MTLRPGDIVTVYRDTGASNGLAFGPDGALYACEGKGRAVVRYGTDGVKTTLVDRFEGRRLNSPNDLVLDRAGRIWFTDPRYGDDHSDRELDHDSVYRITPPGGGEGLWEFERLTFDTTRPNGLLLSWDERTLFVAQSDYDAGSVRQLRAYPIASDGTLGDFTVLHDFGEARGIDGMCWAADDNIVATCGWERSGPGPRIAVFGTHGTVLEEHLLPSTGGPTNCIFGGTNLDVLYVTTLDGRLYRVPNTGRRGYLEPPSIRPYVPRSARLWHATRLSLREGAGPLLRMSRQTLPGSSDGITIDDAPPPQGARHPGAAALPGGARAGARGRLARSLPGLARISAAGRHRPARHPLFRRGDLRCRRRPRRSSTQQNRELLALTMPDSTSSASWTWRPSCSRSSTRARGACRRALRRALAAPRGTAADRRIHHLGHHAEERDADRTDPARARAARRSSCARGSRSRLDDLTPRPARCRLSAATTRRCARCWRCRSSPRPDARQSLPDREGRRHRPSTADDEETLARFATQAALAIENARLHRQVAGAGDRPRSGSASRARCTTALPRYSDT